MTFEPFRPQPRPMGMKAISASTKSLRETVMITKSKIAAALAVLTLATSLTIPSSEAEARGRGWGIAAGVVGAAIVAGAVANAYGEPVYYGDYRRCRFERQYDAYGFYVGTAKVCRGY